MASARQCRDINLFVACHADILCSRPPLIIIGLNLIPRCIQLHRGIAIQRQLIDDSNPMR